MNDIILLVLLAILACLAAYSIHVSRRASETARLLLGRLSVIEKRVSRLESSMLAALESHEAVEKARILKKKRRRRYVATIILYDGRLPPDPRRLQDELRKAIVTLAGEVGYADARPAIVYYDPVRGVAIIRTNHLAINVVLAALPLIKRVGDTRVRVIPIRTCGTLRSAKRAIGVIEEVPSRAA